MTAPENFNFSGEFPIQALFAKVPIYKPYGKISGRAYSGKLREQIHQTLDYSLNVAFRQSG
jgi:hypothetical protein